MNPVLQQHDDKPFSPMPEQQRVIEAAPDEWLLVVAGPGTGKTQVAAMRILYLLQHGLQPAQILVLSFSRSAVATLTRRLAKLQPADEGIVEDLRHMAIRTFDSWAFRMLRQSGVPAAELLSHPHDENIARVTENLNKNDSAMMERLAGIRHVIVDEFQDLPGVRAEMVTALLSQLNPDGSRRVGFTVLGDPAQGIYRFAARNSGIPALVDPWEGLKKRMGQGLREVELKKNHRSTDELAKIADSLRKILGSSILDPTKKLEAMKGFLKRLPSATSAEKLGTDWLLQLADGSQAVLTRTNGEALQVWKMLMGRLSDTPVESVRLGLAGTGSGAPAWIAALLSRFKPSTISRRVFEIAFNRVQQELGPDACQDLNLPPMEVAWRRLARASGASDSATSIDLDELRNRLEWPDSFPDDQVRDDAAVYITTVHQAKGMEFDNVALLEARERTDEKSPEDPLEEASVGFVAATRAGKQLGRLPSSCIYKAPGARHFQHGRVRQVSWGKMVNFQIGLPGDVEAVSFVDPHVHGGEEAVDAVQQALLRGVHAWRGHPVALRQVSAVAGSRSARHVRYAIHLQMQDGDGLLLGRTTWQVTQDLLDLLGSQGYALPQNIYNLRIGDVVSTCASAEASASAPDPWRLSRLWLGISLSGTGDFKTWKRRHGS